MKIILNGKELNLQDCANSLGDTPIGTVISFMGTSAPNGYLVCDGAEYNISEHRSLANFFEQQFGSKNFFGGDGQITFAVPDMRNLFIRGYHGDSEEEYSGEIGERQEGTALPNIGVNSKVNPPDIVACAAKDDDTFIDNYDNHFGSNMVYVAHATYANDPNEFRYVTTRPVNMAVLYCIKAVEHAPQIQNTPDNNYSIEEQQIGTWIDGKIIYQKTIPFSINTTKNTRSVAIVLQDPTIKVLSVWGFLDTTFDDEIRYFIPTIDRNASNFQTFGFIANNSIGFVYAIAYTDVTKTYQGYATIKYTKNSNSETDL